MMWNEFLDFFFLKGASLPLSFEKRKEWWVQLDSKGRQLIPEPDKDGEEKDENELEGDDTMNAANLSGLSG